ncbi:vacuolar protein-sorting-associated protein 25 [Nasonia vitripennis]|uniref:Vacuolar protein-sorting-associated protein 25 n=1 Tax=Nasonia vitripennis TaxID=7425 RepID=A0A7M7T7R1_NASVI|nr:vacuolar protein-sorting-associated protein 25 [Nasonia vitripennis]
MGSFRAQVSNTSSEADGIELFNPNLLERVANQLRGDGLIFRPLNSRDFDKGFLQLLGQLTDVGNITKDQFLNRFHGMKSSGGYYVIVVEDLNCGKVIGSATLVVEQKFIHSCGLRNYTKSIAERVVFLSCWTLVYLCVCLQSSKMTEIDWPWQYSFPPFFTLQPHAETRAKQIAAWKSLVLDYFRTTKQAILDIREIHSTPLFNNVSIDRKLPSEVVSVIVEELAKSGNATPLDKAKLRWVVSWHTLDEWAEIIYSWAQTNGFAGSVCTFYELTQGENTVDQEFHGLDNELLVRALKTLEAAKRAELIIFDDNEGVKFF